MDDTRTNEELNTAVYKKLSAEEDTFRDWLKTLSPDEILHHAYEYVIREDILLNFEYMYSHDKLLIFLVVLMMLYNRNKIYLWLLKDPYMDK